MNTNNQPQIGLSSEEAKKNLEIYGPNDISESSLKKDFLEYLEFLKDPMAILMLSLALIHFLMGEKLDGTLILIAFIPVSIIDVFLEIKTSNALKSFQNSFKNQVFVFRDNKTIKISTLDIVPQDVIVLEEGLLVPADGKIIKTTGLSLNESSLTGESLLINKTLQDEVFAGTVVSSGSALMEVTQTGKKTKFGKVILLLEENNKTESPLQKRIHKILFLVIKIGIALGLLLLTLELVRGKSLLSSLMTALTFGLAAVPEEFPVVFTLYLSLGAMRLSKKGVLVKSLPSVETLGSVDVICTDKTGTLTEGTFKLNEIIPYSNKNEDDLHLFSLLACEPIIVDSMEEAIKNKIGALPDFEHWSLTHDYPFTTKGKHMSHAWTKKDGTTLVTMKGSVEGVLEHSDLTEIEKEKILKDTEKYSFEGFRILGLAGSYKSITGNREFDEEKLEFLGLMLFSDPIRESTAEAIKLSQEKGIIIKMITGDHPLTAHAVADRIGLHHSHDALYTGQDLQKMTEVERKNAYLKGHIFSRVTPQDKFEIIKFLKEKNFIVAMTGDGINDAPAMKIADIGISMGGNSTDIAKDTANMVLYKNDFSGLISAIIEGRKIFKNLQKSFSYLIEFHIPIILVSFIPPLFSLGEVFLPIHIILMELIVHPISAFTFENLEGDGTKNSKDLITKKTLSTSIATGFFITLFSLIPFIVIPEESLEIKRTLALTTILFGNIGFVFLEAYPSFSRRLVMTSLILFSLTLLLTTTDLSILLKFSKLDFLSIGICFGLGILASIPSFVIRNSKR